MSGGGLGDQNRPTSRYNVVIYIVTEQTNIFVLKVKMFKTFLALSDLLAWHD